MIQHSYGSKMPYSPQSINEEMKQTKKVDDSCNLFDGSSWIPEIKNEMMHYFFSRNIILHMHTTRHSKLKCEKKLMTQKSLWCKSISDIAKLLFQNSILCILIATRGYSSYLKSLIIWEILAVTFWFCINLFLTFQMWNKSI